MFIWVSVGLAALIAGGAALIIYWDEIKNWVSEKFAQLSSKVKKAYANLLYKGGRLIKKIFFVEDGKPKVIENPRPQTLTLDQLEQAYRNGELTKEQYENLKKEIAVEVGSISR